MKVVPEWLFPDERTFFARFVGVADQVHSAAGLLKQAFEDPGSLPAVVGEIEQVNRQADSAARELDLGADRLFIPPMDREDIHALSVSLAGVVDFVGGTARRAASLRIAARREEAVALAALLVRATEEITGGLARIREGDEVLRHCRAIKQAEEEGDGLWEQAMTELFQGHPDPLDVLRWKTVYDQLEATLDACDNVANVLETITLKHG